MAENRASANCLLCRKTLPRVGVSAFLDFRKTRPSFHGCQGERSPLLNGLQHAQQQGMKPVLIDDDGSGSEKEDYGFLNVRDYMQDLESQVGLLRSENYETKVVLHQLLALARVSNFEARENNKELMEKIDGLDAVLEQGCSCSVNLDGQVRAVNCGARVIKGKSEDIRNKNMELLDGLDKEKGAAPTPC